MNGCDELRNLPQGLHIALAVLLAVQVTLIIAALIVLARTPKEKTRHLPKPIWVLVILLANGIGPIIFFAVGRE